MAFFESWTLNIGPAISPPSTLAKKGEFPDLLVILENMTKKGTPTRGIAKYFIRLCRVSMLATLVWLTCLTTFMSSIFLALLLWYFDDPQGAAHAKTVKPMLALSIAVFICSAFTSGAVRYAAVYLSDEIISGGSSRSQGSQGTDVDATGARISNSHGKP
jgi:hypothetical protein